ncbi:BppU family phage baseplate upper protein [Lactococcus raffinolactis]|uniref:BppU family phage baseplate upper protein n=1 Tax=Pseudolactococcus raffinolactis TaxID=1366 RepID=UPI000BB471C8|nr:BppU family phage baseplate upper protein [Lactococcus raffinolactis]ATC60413.1 hypothetical protein CMV25_00290 [Lactococcus raffinolactis]
MANMIFNLDLNKNNAINPIIFGRLTDGNLRKITVNITNEGEPVDLTDWVIRFEGTTGGRAKVFDVLGVNILDAKNGKFEYTFSKTAFSASGAYRQAYFAIEKDNMRETTNDIKIVVENIADLDAQDAETVVTELNKTITLINQKYDELNGRVKKYEGDIASLEEWLLGKKTEIENIIESANSTFNQKLSEIQAKLDKINQAIEKGSETIAYAYSADGSDRFTTVYPNENLLDGTKDFSGTWSNSSSWVTDGTYNGLTVKKRTSQWNGISKTFTAPKDGVYTFSAYIKSSGSNANIYRYGGVNGRDKGEVSKFIGNNFDWIRDTITLNLKANDTIWIRYEISGAGTDSILWTAGHKWENGSTATPWMPSSSEATTADYPSYIGYSNKVKTNKVASDYTWFPDLTNKVEDHVNNKSNPHAVTASQTGAYTKAETSAFLGQKADDSIVVHKAGDETINGKKNFDAISVNKIEVPITTATVDLGWGMSAKIIKSGNYVFINGTTTPTANVGSTGGVAIGIKVPEGFRPLANTEGVIRLQGNNNQLGSVLVSDDGNVRLITGGMNTGYIFHVSGAWVAG